MSFGVLAFNSSIATGTALVDCKSISDPKYNTQSGDGYVVTNNYKLMIGAFAFGANMTRAQIQCPHFQITAYQEVGELNDTAGTANSVFGFQSLMKSGRGLITNEDLIVQVVNGGSSAENETVGVFVADKLPTPVDKDHFSIRFTGSTTLTANTWTNVQLTLDRSLPAGDYGILGARVYSAGGLLFRFELPGDAWGPGGVCVNDDAQIDIEGQRHGGWGQWGMFAQNLLPTIDILSTSADTTQHGVIDVIKLS